MCVRHGIACCGALCTQHSSQRERRRDESRVASKLPTWIGHILMRPVPTGWARSWLSQGTVIRTSRSVRMFKAETNSCRLPSCTIRTFRTLRPPGPGQERLSERVDSTERRRDPQRGLASLQPAPVFLPSVRTYRKEAACFPEFLPLLCFGRLPPSLLSLSFTQPTFLHKTNELSRGQKDLFRAWAPKGQAAAASLNIS